MSSSSRDPAWSRGASSERARSFQWPPSGRPEVGAAPTSTSEAATATAPSQVAAVCRGDQRSGSTVPPLGNEPVGSNSRQRPIRPRTAEVAATTSGLVEVDTTGPAAAKRLGMTTDEVFPERGGPSTSMECSGRAKCHWSPPWPRYRAWPAAAEPAVHAAWRAATCAAAGSTEKLVMFDSRPVVARCPMRRHAARGASPSGSSVQPALVQRKRCKQWGICPGLVSGGAAVRPGRPVVPSVPLGSARHSSVARDRKTCGNA